MSNRLAVTPQYLLPKRVITVLAGKFANLARRRAHPRRHPQVRRPVRGRHVRSGGAGDRELRHVQRLLHARLARGRAADRRCAVRVPGRRRDQPVRPDRARPDLPGQGAQLFHPRPRGRRPGAGASLRPRPLRHAVPGAARLPPHPHAVRRPAGAHDLRAGRPVLGQSADGAPRAEPVRAQRAGGLRVRHAVRAVRQRAGRRDDRRQRRHRVARRGQPAAHPRHPRVALRRPERRAGQGCRDGPVPAGVHGRHAVPEERARFRPGLGPDPRRCGWASRWPRPCADAVAATGTPPRRSCAACGCAAAAAPRRAGSRWPACRCAGAGRPVHGRTGWPSRAA